MQPGTTNSGIGTNQIESGISVTSDPNDVNILSMAPGSFSNVTAGTQFAVSMLTYHNGQTALGTSATALPVTVTVDFSAPPGIPPQAFDFTYSLDITPNNSTPLSNPANDDILTVPVSFAPENFTFNGNTYTLHLLGFSTDGGATLNSQFVLPEEDTTSSTLYGEITAPVPGTVVTPLPSSAWAGLFLIGGLGVLQIRRRAFARA